jgi:hypothetical protein
MDMDISIDNLEILKKDNIKLQKMLFLYNALQDGWCVKKLKESYIFTKKHENKQQVFEESYLLDFMKTNMNIK